MAPSQNTGGASGVYSQKNCAANPNKFSPEPTTTILTLDLYGTVDKEDGWLISDLNDDDNAAFGPIEMSVEEQMHWSAIKAEFLCPKM